LRLPLRNPGWAAVLSFLMPGLGQAVGGKPTRGAIVAIPAVAFFFVFLPLFLFANASLIGSSATLTSLLLVDLIGCLYHIWAVVDAYRQIKPPFIQAGMRGLPDRRASIPLEFAAMLGLVAATVGVHAFFGAVDLNSCVMRGSSPCPETDPVVAAVGTQNPASPASLAPNSSASATASAIPTPGSSGSTTGAFTWTPVADRIRVHSGPGTQYATIRVLRQWQPITGQVVVGGSYATAGASRTDWIKIDKGLPGAGGYVAAAYFLQGTSGGPSGLPSASATPTASATTTATAGSPSN